MDGIIVKQLFDKLMQKVFFLTIRHEFKEVDGNWGNKEEMKEEVEEAKQYLEVLVGTVEKRDAVYQTTMKDKIEAGINQIEKAVEDGDKLAFLLGKQVVDKTLMKTFYLAVGALPHGYAGKVAAEASVDAKKAKTEQAEGWAFYQSIYGYIVKNAEEQAEFIQKQFDLSTDVKTLDPEAINKAFVVGFSKVALHEYEESVENWGQDKSVVTALEGALFIDIIEADLKRIIGEDAFKTLNDQTQKYLDAVKAQNKDQAEQLLENIKKTLNDVVAKASAA